MTCSWLVQYLFMSLVHNLFTTCSCHLFTIFTTCSWLDQNFSQFSCVHDENMTCSQLVHDTYDLFTTSTLPHQKLVKSIWSYNYITTTSQLHHVHFTITSQLLHDYNANTSQLFHNNIIMNQRLHHSYFKLLHTYFIS